MTDQTEKTETEFDLSDFTALIVEDFSFIAQILSLSLQEMGVGNVMTAENGALAQNKIQAFNSLQNDKSIDVIILDWLMPVMDGKELIKWIRAHKKDTIKFIPIVVCSGYTSEKLVFETRDLGANEVIVKPVSASEIARRIQYVINKPRPFVQSKTFFGPDRRRQNKRFEGENKRIAKPQDIKNTHEQK